MNYTISKSEGEGNLSTTEQIYCNYTQTRITFDMLHVGYHDQTGNHIQHRKCQPHLMSKFEFSSMLYAKLNSPPWLTIWKQFISPQQVILPQLKDISPQLKDILPQLKVILPQLKVVMPQL